MHQVPRTLSLKSISLLSALSIMIIWHFIMVRYELVNG